MIVTTNAARAIKFDGLSQLLNQALLLISRLVSSLLLGIVHFSLRKQNPLQKHVISAHTKRCAIVVLKMPELATAQPGLNICDGWNNQFMLPRDIRSQLHLSFAVRHY